MADSTFIVSPNELTASSVLSLSNEDLSISLYSSREKLVSRGSVVIWYKGNVISRKLKYQKNVVNCFFTVFSTGKEENVTSDQDRALVVVLDDSLFIYYKDGKNYVLSFPFQINNALPYENGIILERLHQPFNQFLTINEPMKELGNITSSSTSSIHSNESLLHFPESNQFSITATLDPNANSINIYSTRFLKRSDSHLSPHSNIKRKPSQSIRRSSLATNNKEDISASADEIKIEKKRGVSHSQFLSIDRMASYDFNAKSTDTMSYSSIEPTALRKDAFLYKLESINLNAKAQFKEMKVKVLKFGSKEAVILHNSKIGLFQILIFELSTYTNTTKLIKFTNLADEYIDYGLPGMDGFMITLDKKNRLALYNPFLQLTTSLVNLSKDGIEKIYDATNNELAFEDKHGNYVTLNLVLEPRTETIKTLLETFKWLTNPYTYHYIKGTWISSFEMLKNEWEAYVLTILSLVLPMAIAPGRIPDSNIISRMLNKVSILQMKAIENQFSITEMAPSIVLSIHILREEFKLNILNTKIIDDLGLLLANLTYWMGWGEDWFTYYNFEVEEITKMVKFQQAPLLSEPPNLLRSLSSLFDGDIEHYCTLSRLAQEGESVDELITPRTFFVLRLFEAIISTDFSPIDIVNMMTEFNFTSSTLETYPVSILVPLKETISYCQEHITSLDDNLQNYGLLERKDLEILTSGVVEKQRPKNNGTLSHQTKDIHQVISSIQDLSEPLAPIEHDRFTVTKLIFSEDRSFYEISKILQTFQVQTVIADDIANLSEQEYLARQQELSSLVSLRTLTIPIGRSMLFFSSKVPLVTERFPVPKMNFNTLIQPENITVSYERSNVNSSALQWGNFHNGAASGLTISKDAHGISCSWIVFNKPDTLTPQHGGFLLGLGLNGHLRALEEWNIYNYLGPKHSFTSVGLLLGMSASLRGTMDTKLTKVLSVHVVALLPRGASDLIISAPVQTAGLIGIGLLYLETQHRRMSEILLSQINSNVVAEEKQVANESYRLAAGIGLGYVNLGKGNNLQGLNDTHVIDKLFEIAVSVKDVQSEDGYDKSMAGAIIALAFIYLKTGNDSVSRKLQIPETEQLLDYIRPDILLLRALSQSLILWDKIENSRVWIELSIPKILRLKADRINYFYVVSGLCLSIGIKYASTADLVARNTILEYYDEVTNLLYEFKADATFIQRQRKRALLNTQMVLAISLSLIMAATGDLETFRRLRILHGKFNNLTKDETYGKLMATNMALGFLFLGGGQYAFDTTSNFAIAALVSSIYPLFPNSENSEPDIYLQALRHFWALAVEPRCLVVKDVETNKPTKINALIEFKNGKSTTISTPCLLPSLELVKRLIIEEKEYYKLVIDDTNRLKENTEIYVFKKKKIEVLKHSVKVVLDTINDKFDKSASKQTNLVDLELFKNFKKSDVSFLLDEEPSQGFNTNIIDRQIELNYLVSNPKNADDLWNLKLVFSYFDRVLKEEDAYYLTIEFIDMLQNKLWSFARSL